MKLLMSVVHQTDAGPLIDKLLQKRYRATLVSTTGGFLKDGNATIIIGVDNNLIDDVLATIEENCHARTQHTLPAVLRVLMPSPSPVKIGKATVFILNVEQFHQF